MKPFHFSDNDESQSAQHNRGGAGANAYQSLMQINGLAVCAEHLMNFNGQSDGGERNQQCYGVKAAEVLLEEEASEEADEDGHWDGNNRRFGYWQDLQGVVPQIERGGIENAAQKNEVSCLFGAKGILLALD